MMLPLDVNHRQRVFVLRILLCGMFFKIHARVDSATYRPKNMLFVTGQNTSANFPSDALYLEKNGLHLCFNIMSNKTQAGCCENFNCRFEITTKGDGVGLILDKGTLHDQDIVVITNPNLNFSCMPSTLYNKAGIAYGPPQYQSSFLLNIHNCLKNGKKNVRLSEGLCNKTTPVENCTDGNVSKYKVLVTFPGNVTCVLCKPVPPPASIPSLKLPITDDPSRPEVAANILKNLSSWLEKLGNHSIATITIGNVKGVINKLPQHNHTKLGFGLTTSGNVNVLNDSIDSAIDYSITVEIPKVASEMAVKANSTFAGVLFFPGMKPQDPSSSFLNNEAVGIEMTARVFNLSQTVDIQFSNVNTRGQVASCRSWDDKESENEAVWITDGCETVEINDTITCRCSHLTFFALLLSPAPRNITASDLRSLTYITSIGCGLSLFFLLVALFMYCVIRNGKASQASQILVNLFLAMSVLNLSFLTNESIANLGIFGACVAIAAVMHYSLLATFTWFFMQALHLYFHLYKVPTEIKHYVRKICIAGWVTPAVVVIGLLASQKYDSIVISADDGNTRKMCWISDAVIHQAVNIGYYAIVFLFTLSMFIVIVWQICFFKSATENNQKSQDNSSTKSNAFSILGLVLLLGITWAFAFFSYGPLTIPSYYIFTILNSFQGFFLCVYYYKSSKTVQQDKTQEDSVSSTVTSNDYTKSPYG